MNDYMKALHQRFFREPEFPGLQRELEETEQILQEKLPRQDRRWLLRLADLEIELREEVSLAAFTAGLQLGLGIAGELEPYSFEDEEEGSARFRRSSRRWSSWLDSWRLSRARSPTAISPNL